MKNFILILAMLITGLTANSLKAQGYWTLQTNPTSDVGESMQFVSASEGWVGLHGSGQLLHTTDAGITWNIVTPNSDDVTFGMEVPGSRISFVNPSTGWVMKSFTNTSEANLGAVLYKTTNGGATWSRKVLSTTSGDLGLQVQFVDANNGWVSIYNTGTSSIRFLNTTDGGSNWTSTNGIGIFYYVNATTGYAFSFSSSDVPQPTIFYKTTDGGTNWTPQYVDNVIGSETNPLNAIEFTDVNNGWIVGYDGKIFHTTDGGTNWNRVTNALPNNNYKNRISSFINNTTGWISSYDTSYETNGPVMLTTTDGGATWSTQRLTFDGAVCAMDFWDANHGWVVSDDGPIAKYSAVNTYPSIGIVGEATSGWETDIAMNTTDGITYTITAYTFKNGGAKFRQDNAWAINWGSNAFPLGTGTQDGPNIPVIAGKYDVTFNRITGAYDFANPVNSDWTLQNNPAEATADVGKIQFVSATEGWISISKGGLLHTTNGGTTWTEVPLDLPEVTLSSMIDPAFNMCFINKSTGWVLKSFGANAFDSNGAVVYKTTNGGLNWQKIILSQVPKDMGGQIQFIDENNGYASIVNTESGLGKYYKTTNGGTTWSLLPSDGTVGILYTLDLNNAWAILGTLSQTPPFIILHSDNGMASFTPQWTDNSPGAFWAIQFTDLNHGWVVGQNGKILKTTDGGVYWDTITNAGITSDYTCKSVYFMNATTGWIGAQIDNSSNKITSTNNAIVLHTKDGGANWTTQSTPANNPFSISFWDENNGWFTSDDNKIVRFTGTLGVKENIINKYLTIYPNPNNGTFYFSLKETNSKVKAEIFTLSGQKVFEASNFEMQPQNEINFAPQSKGIYLIKITDGLNSYSEKIMIQ